MIATAAASAALAAPPQEILGNWKIVAPLDFADITTRDARQARQLVGHMLKIQETGAQLDGYRCAVSDSPVQIVETSLYVRDYAEMDAKKLHLPNPVTVVDLSCTQIFIKQTNRIVFFWDGWFFEAVRSTLK